MKRNIFIYSFLFLIIGGFLLVRFYPDYLYFIGKWEIDTNDTIPPTVEIIEPQEGEEVQSKFTLIGKVQDLDNRIEGVYLSINKAEFDTAVSSVSATEPFEWQYTVKKMEKGSMSTIDYYAIDYAGNVSATNTFYVKIMTNQGPVDITPPLISVTSPKDGTIYSNGMVSIKGSALDAGGFGSEGVYLSINGNEREKIGTTSYNTFEIFEDGEHTINLQAVDAAGNTSEEKEISFTVDSTLSSTPVLTVNSPEEDETYVTEVIISGTATDSDGFGENGVFVKVNDGEYAKIGESSFYSNMSLENGDHSITIKAIDSLGNETPEKQISFSVSLKSSLVWTLEPKVNDVDTDSFDITAILSGPATVYYAVYGDNPIDPKSYEVKNGDYALDWGMQVVEDDVEFDEITWNGIEAGESYDFYIVAEDQQGILMSEPFKIDITLMDGEQ